MFRRLLLFGVPAVALIVVAAAAGWWFLIREDNELADAAPAIPADLRSTATAPADTAAPGSSPAATTPAGSAGGFAVLPDRSDAAYFADEKLASLSLPSTAKGTTKQVAGQFYLQGTGLDPTKESKFTVDLRKLTSNESRRDTRVQDALQTSRFPNATFLAKALTGPVASLNASSDTELKLTGMLEINGVQREVTWDVKAKRDGNILTALATVNFKYADFGVAPPSIAGFVSVEDDVTLQVQVTAQQS